MEIEGLCKSCQCKLKLEKIGNCPRSACPDCKIRSKDFEHQNTVSEQSDLKKLLQNTPSDYIIDRMSLQSRMDVVSDKIFVEISRKNINE